MEPRTKTCSLAVNIEASDQSLPKLETGNRKELAERRRTPTKSYGGLRTHQPKTGLSSDPAKSCFCLFFVG